MIVYELNRTVETRLALVAHDGKKHELVLLARANRSLLTRFRLVATRSTGRLVAEETGLDVTTVAGGPEGGDLQIGAMIVDGSIDALVFLRDPLTSHPHEPDIHALLKACDVHRVPVATNRATAQILLQHLGRQRSFVTRSTTHPSMAGKGGFPWDPARRTPRPSAG